jgi:hypothetical protein
MDEHSINLGHHILLKENNILTKRSKHRYLITPEETQTKLHSNNMNREEGFFPQQVVNSHLYL